jgi:hypothetical protein
VHQGNAITDFQKLPGNPSLVETQVLMKVEFLNQQTADTDHIKEETDCQADAELQH